MISTILFQLLTIAFAIACAGVNKWAVYKFRETGASIKMEKEFHAANAWVKVLWAVGPLVLFPSLETVILLPLLLVIQWLVFDCALNKFTGKDMFYVGETSTIDKWLQNTFQFTGAGEAKAVLCGCVILAVNLFVL